MVDAGGVIVGGGGGASNVEAPRFRLMVGDDGVGAAGVAGVILGNDGAGAALGIAAGDPPAMPRASATS